MASFLAPLRHGPFARYITGEAISMVGTWMQLFAQGWVLTTLTASAFALGALNFTSGLPMLLLAMVGGSAADRFDKRLILQVVLGVQALTAATIGWLIWRDRIEMWHLFVAAGVLGLVTPFEVPAVSAFVPELVPREEITNAIAIDRAVFQGTRLIGPSVSGYIVGLFGAAAAYFVNTLTFFALMVAVLTIPRRIRGTAEQEEERRGSMMAGLAYVRRDPPLLKMVLLMSSMSLFVSPFLMVAMPLYTRRTLGLEADAMGWLMACSGAGALVGAFGLLSIPHGRRATAIKVGVTVAVAAMLAMAAAHSFWVAAAAIVVNTLGLSTCFGIANIVIQERAPNELRGRVSAVASLSYFGIIPFSGLLVTKAIDLAGMRPAMVGGACGYALTATLLLAGTKRLATAPPATAG